MTIIMLLAMWASALSVATATSLTVYTVLTDDYYDAEWVFGSMIFCLLSWVLVVIAAGATFEILRLA